MHLLKRERRDARASRHLSCSLGRAACRCALLSAVAWGSMLSATPAAALAKPPEPWEGTVVRWADGDTVWMAREVESQESRVESQTSRLATRNSPLIKIRLHWADAPEIAHSKNDIGQAAGIAAWEHAQQLWPPGTQLHVQPRATSYDRIVADLDCDGVDVALAMTRAGYAWNDPRYKPSAALRAAEAIAHDSHRGLWDETKYGPAVPPWQWRKQKRGTTDE